MSRGESKAQLVRHLREAVRLHHTESLRALESAYTALRQVSRALRRELRRRHVNYEVRV